MSSSVAKMLVDNQVLVIALFSIAVSLFHSYYSFVLKRCNKLTLIQFLSLVLASSAIFSSLKLIIVAFQPAAGTILSIDDRVVLYLGSVAVIWISLGEILKLFQKPD